MKEKGHNSPKSGTGIASGEEELTPVKQSNSMRKSSNNNNEMPSLSEETMAALNHSDLKQQMANNCMSGSNLSVNQSSEMPSQPTSKSVNFLLDYLLNSSKGGLISSNSMTGGNSSNKLDVSNLAALAALVDLRENGGEMSVGGGGGSGAAGINSPMDPTNTEMMLKNLLIDLVSPPLVVTSQFDLSSAGSSVEHLELQLNYKENSPNGQLNNLNARPQIDSASFNINFGQANGGNSNTSKKQVKKTLFDILFY